MTIASFFPGVSGGQVSRSVTIMGWCLRFLDSPKREKHEKLMGRFCPGLMEHLIPTQPVEDYSYLIRELQELYEQALQQYPRMLEELQQFKKTGDPLSSLFTPDFG